MAKGPAVQRANRKPRLRTLEPRMVFDGAADATAKQVAAQSMPEFMLAEGGFAPDRVAAGIDAAPVASSPAADLPAHEIVFVSDDVPDWQQLVADVDPDVRVVVLDSRQDGIEQIAAALAGEHDVTAIHIISHGSAGELDLGTARLNAQTMQGTYRDELATIGQVLTADGDILVYGCDFGAGEDGAIASATLATLTGADIAASNDVTGAGDLGGDWVLERQVGTVETSLAVSEAARGSYAHLLEAQVNTGSGAIISTTGKGIYSVDVATGKATLITTVPGTVGGFSTGTQQNALAIDQQNGLIYYTGDNQNASRLDALFAYDYVSGQHFVVDGDLSNDGVILGTQGLQSGGAVFANGKLYLGVEAISGGRATSRIYEMNLAPDGRSLQSGTVLKVTISGEAFGDFGVSGDGTEFLVQTSAQLVRYRVSDGVRIGSATTAIAGQSSTSIDGKYYVIGTQIQEINPVTGAGIGSAKTVTTNGTTGLGASVDSARWTPPTGEIGDKIFDDNNGNGVFDAGDQGLSGLTVELIDDVNNNGVADAGERILATDTTDADGNYLFTGVLPGNYITRVSGLPSNTPSTTGASSTAAGFTRDADMTSIGGSNLAADFGFDVKPPVVDLNGTASGTGYSGSWTEGNGADGGGNTPVRISDANATVTDADSANLTSMAIVIANGSAGDILSLAGTLPSGITASWDPVSYTLTLTGTATVANYQTALGLVRYNNTTDTPAAGTRTINVSTVDNTNLVSNTAVANIVVTPVNDAPVDGDEAVSTPEDTPVSGNVLDNASDAESGPLSVTQFTIDGQSYAAGETATIAGVGTLLINSDGSYTFTPVADWNGTVPVATYTISDGQGGSDTSTLAITVDPVNDAPVDGDESVSTPEDTPVSGNVLDNAGDVDGDTLSVTQFTIDTDGDGTPELFTAGDTATIAGVGTLLINADGSYTFTPAENYNGPVPVATYTVSDGTLTDTSTLAITVDPVNDAPVDGDEAVSTPEDTPVSGNVLDNATDVDGDALSVTQFTIDTDGDGTPELFTAGDTATIAGVGTLVINSDGSYTFTPDADYNGTVPVATYTVSDGQGGSDSSTLAITVDPVNDAPVSTALSDQAGMDGTAITPVDVSGSFSDPDGDPLRFTASDLPPGLTIDPDTGVISGTPTNTASQGGNTGTPGVYTVTVTATDPEGLTTTQSFTYTVGNPAPTAVDDAVTIPEDGTASGNLLANDSDPDGDPLSVTQFTVNGTTFPADGTPQTIAGVGTIAIDADGSYTFTPDANWHGTVPPITYTITDGQGGTATAELDITVTPVNDAPVDGDESVSTPEDSPVSGNVLDNAGDVDGDPLSVTQFTIDGQSYAAGDTATIAGVGTLLINADGSYTFTPVADWNGTVPVATYTVSDGQGGSDTSTLAITVTPVDDPLAIGGLDDGDVAGTDGSVRESDLANGTNPDGTGEEHSGTFTLDVPDGIESLTVGGTTITAAELAASGTTPIVIDTAHGRIAINGFDAATGVVSYTFTLTSAADHTNGPVTDDIALTVTDIQGDSQSGTLRIDIVDDAPVTADDDDNVINRPGNPSSTATGNVLTGVDPGTDPNTMDGNADTLGADGGSVSAVAAGTGAPSGGVGDAVSGSYGVLTLNADGSYTYTPDFDDPDVQNLGAQETLTDTFTYQVKDADGDTATATLTITIFGTPAIIGLEDGELPGTDGSVFEADLSDGTNPAGPGETVNGSFLVIARPDVPTDHIIVGGTEISAAELADSGETPITIETARGTIVIDGFDADTGKVSYTYTLRDNVSHASGPQSDDIALSIYDTDGNHGDTTLRIAIEDDAPQATNDTATATEDGGAISGSVIDNDNIGADSVADPVTGVMFGTGTPAGSVGSDVAGAYGTLVLQSDGTYSYTVDNANPAVQALGSGETLKETFTYTITDSDGDSTTATLTITIDGVNDAPVDGDESVSTPEDTPVSGNVLDNAGDVDGDTLSVTQFTIDTDGDGTPELFTAGDTATIAGVGTLLINSDGSYTFTPVADWNGTVPVATYTISDGQGGSDTSTLAITVDPVNDAPVDGDESVSTPEDTPVSGNVLDNAGDVDGDTLSVTQFTIDTDGDGTPELFTAGDTATIAGVGTLVINSDGSYTFTPVADYNGTVPVATYTVSEGQGGSDTSTLAITVDPVNDAPVDGDESVSTPEDTPVSGNVLDNAGDVDGDTLSVTQFTIDTDGDGTPELFTAGDTATIAGVGTLLINADGSYTFTPAENYNGPVPVATYTVSDGTLTDTSTLAITVDPVNDAPVDGDESVSTPEDTPVSGNVLDNAGDVDGDALSVTQFTIDTDGDGAPELFNAGDTATIAGVGTLLINADGSYTFTPVADYNGTVPVATYTVSDGTLTDSSTLAITVDPVNDAPVDGDESVSTPEDTPVSGNVLDNAGDVEGDPLSVTQFTIDTDGDGTPELFNAGDTATIAGVGTLLINADGSYTFTPAENYNGPVPVATYTVSDGTLTDSSTLAITVDPVNDAPVDGDEAVSTPEDTPVSGNVLDNAGDVDGDTLSVTRFTIDTDGDGTPELFTAGDTATIAGVGTLLINADGSYTFTPVADYNGTVPIATYTVSDGTLTDTSTLAITVDPVNDAPVDGDDSVSTPEDTPVSGNVLDNAGDVDGDPLSVTEFTIDGQSYAAGETATIAGVGTLLINADGSYTFTPDANWHGTVPPISYTITDGQGGTATAELDITVDPVNDAPVDGDEAVSTPEDTPVSGNVLDNAGDVEGDPLSVTEFTIDTDGDGTPELFTAGDTATIAGVGTLVINADGSYTFTPVADWNGTVPVATYTVSDGQGGSDTSTLAITVDPVNDAPVDGDEAVSTPEDTPVSGNVLDNADDVDGDALSVTQFTIDTDGDGTPELFTAGDTATIAGVGTLLINADGSYTFTPAENYNGPVPVATYTVSDGQGGSDTSTLAITVDPVNDAPVDGDEAVSTPEDTPVSGNVLDNAGDVDGDPLSVTRFTIDTDGDGTPELFTAGDTATIAGVGTLLINSDGSYTFTPAENYNGPVPVATYTVSDGTLTDTSTLAITVDPVNDAPVDGDESVSTPEDTPVSGNVLDNAGDVDGDALSVTQFTIDTDGDGTPELFTAGDTATIAGVGTLLINADGSYTFTPVADYNGTVPVATYTVSDGTLTDTSTLAITVDPVNDAPVDGDESVSTPEDTPVSGNVLDNAGDVEGDPLSVTEFTIDTDGDGTPELFTAGDTATIAGVGTLVINADGSYTFTPVADWNGTVPVATYTVSDGQGGSDTSTLAITVDPVNDAPVDGDEAVSTPEDTPVSGNVLDNADDVDGDALSVTQFTIDTDGDGTPELFTAGDTATIAGVGTLLINADGSYTFTPAENYNGPVPVATYTVSDGTLTDSSTLAITVDPVNDAPVDGDEAVSTPEDTPVSGNVLDNASDVEGDPLSVTRFTIDTDGDGTPELFTAGDTATIAGVGTLVINADGSYTFTPAENYNGPVPVATYTVSDGTLTDTSTLAITVDPVNDAPVDGDESVSTPEDTPVSGNVLDNAGDVDGDALSVTQFTIDTDGDGTPELFTAGDTATIAGVGTLLINADGSYTFTPVADYNGTVPVATYTVSDGTLTDTSTLAITVDPVNDAPVDGDEAVSTPEDTPVSGNVLDNASDVEGDPLSVTRFTIDTDGDGTPELFTAGDTATIAGVGTLLINADGSYTFTPAENYNGPVPVATYTVSDGTLTDTSTLAITVDPVNDAPVDGDEAVSTPEDTPVSGNVLDNAGDVDGDALSVTRFTIDTDGDGTPELFTAGDTATIAGVGTLLINADGSYTFTPVADYNGTVPIATYTVSDGTLTDTSTLAITVDPVNDAPVDGDESVSTPEDTPVSGNVLDNAGDVDGDPLSVTEFTIDGQSYAAGETTTIAGVGTLLINADGSYTFTPDANWHGTVPPISYTITDGQGGTATAELDITVDPVNDAPVSTALSDQAGMDGTAITPVDVSGSFSDPDGDPLRFTASDLPPGLTIDPDTGVISGTPTNTASQGGNTGTPGVYTVTVTATDPDGLTTTQSFTYTVGNPAPTAVDDAVTIPEDGTASGNLLANDSDPDGDPLSVTQFTVNGTTFPADGTPQTIAGVGTIAIDADGSYTFTPDANWHGTVPPITYTITDGQGGTATAELDITVDPVNDAPVSTALSDQAGMDGTAITPVDVSGSFSDPDGDPLRFTASDLPPGLTIDPDTGVISGTPTNTASQGGNTGTPGVYMVTVTATDPDGLTTTQSFTYTVGNPAPTAVDDAVTIPEDGTASGNLLANDSDPDGDPLSVTQFTVNGTTFPADGTPQTIAGVGTIAIDADGSYIFTPDPNWHGTVPPISYTITDGQGGTATAELDITVDPVNDVPVSTALSDQAGMDGTAITPVDVSGSFSDPDGDPLRFTASDLPPGLTIDPDTGVISGTPTNTASQGGNTGTPGVYMVTVTATDPDGLTTTQSFTYTVGNPAPTAVDDAVTIPEDGTASGNLLANDSDPDGDPLSVTQFTVNGTTFPADGTPQTIAGVGTIAIDADGSYIFTPDPNWHGTVPPISYTITDGQGGTATAELDITVDPVNDVPPLSYVPPYMPLPNLPDSNVGGVSTPAIVYGVIADTVEQFDSLRSISAGIAIDRPIETTANALRNLGGSTFRPVGHYGAVETAVAQLGRHTPLWSSRVGLNQDGVFDLHPFLGGASMVEFSSGSRDGARDELRLETTRRDDVIHLRLARPGADADAVLGYRIKAAAGTPAVDWLVPTAPDLYSGSPPAGTGSVDLEISVTRRDGLVVTYTIRLDTITGQITRLDKAPTISEKQSQNFERAPMFSEQLRDVAKSFGDRAALERALGLS